jgi:hypothetical protein
MTSNQIPSTRELYSRLGACEGWNRSGSGRESEREMERGAARKLVEGREGVSMKNGVDELVA